MATNAPSLGDTLLGQSSDPATGQRAAAGPLDAAANPTDNPPGTAATVPDSAAQATADTQMTGSQIAANTTVPTSASPTPSPSAAIHPAVEMVSVQLTKAAGDKLDQLSIQLHPADLGNIQVKLHFGEGGSVHAAIIADKPETLALMQRDAHGLTSALNDAGLKTDGSSLSFDLRGGQNGQMGGQNGQGSGSGGSQNTQTASSLPPTLTSTQQINLVASSNGTLTNGHLDLRVLTNIMNRRAS